MKLFFHYCSSGFSNCYVLGTEHNSVQESSPREAAPHEASPLEAIIIDPGDMDPELLGMIENNNYAVRGVLITHDHSHHVQGLKTITRIYGCEIFAINPLVSGHRATIVRDGDLIDIGAFKTEVISVPGHSADSAVYKIDRFLFTGDALSAGLVGRTASSYAAATQVSALRNKICSLPGEYTVLPGHGPPSSLEAERRFNLGLNTPAPQKARRPAFRIEF